MLYSCTHMTTVGFKGLIESTTGYYLQCLSSIITHSEFIGYRCCPGEFCEVTLYFRSHSREQRRASYSFYWPVSQPSVLEVVAPKILKNMRSLRFLSVQYLTGRCKARRPLWHAASRMIKEYILVQFYIYIYTVTGKKRPPKQNAQYIIQSNDSYTALSNTHLGTVCKISMNCVSCVVIFFIF